MVELASFGQYYTDIMAPIVGPKGHIWMYDLPYLDQKFGDPSRAFVMRHPNTEFAQARFDEMEWPKNIDLITMGTHGRGGVRRLAIGSVAENVVLGSEPQRFGWLSRRETNARAERALGKPDR